MRRSTGRRILSGLRTFIQRPPKGTGGTNSARYYYSDLAVLGTREFLHGIEVGYEHQIDLEPGKRLLIGLQSVSEADERGLRTGMFNLNGQLRPVQVRDEKVSVDVKAAEKADPSQRGHVAAPFAGVVSLAVEEGAAVEAGAVVTAAGRGWGPAAGARLLTRLTCEAPAAGLPSKGTGSRSGQCPAETPTTTKGAHDGTV